MITSAWNQENIEFEVKEGPDILCQACTYFNGASCIHPKGDEKAVRKWDRAILDGLCLNYNQVIKIKDLKSLIISKIPIDFCSSKCQYHKEKRCNPHQIADCLK